MCSSSLTRHTKFATVEIVAGGGTPELIRGQSVMAFSQGDNPPVGTTSQATMVYDNRTLSRAADDSFTGEPFVIDPAPVDALLEPLEENPPNNAKVLTGILNPDIVNRFVIDTLKSQMIPVVSAASPAEADPSSDIFLPMIPK